MFDAVSLTVTKPLLPTRSGLASRSSNGRERRKIEVRILNHMAEGQEDDRMMRDMGRGQEGPFHQVSRRAAHGVPRGPTKASGQKMRVSALQVTFRRSTFLDQQGEAKSCGQTVGSPGTSLAHFGMLPPGRQGSGPAGLNRVRRERAQTSGRAESSALWSLNDGFLDVDMGTKRRELDRIG